jgi:hypothetical protein|tara:strand:- start:1435 stop:1641 length:207 start_codon:yes stop_codon:yes gene_type:complete
MTNFNDSTVQMTAEEIKQQLKALKKKVKQMEAQRERIRDWAHKAELLDAKKMKLKYKQILEELDKDET